MTSQIEIVTSVDIPQYNLFCNNEVPFNAACGDVASWRNDQTDWKQAFAKLINFSSLNHLGDTKILGGTAPACPPVATGLYWLSIYENQSSQQLVSMDFMRKSIFDQNEDHVPNFPES